MAKHILITSQYFGPVQSYCHILEADKVTVEQFDNYEKKTYRNRTTILAANGPMNLTLPVVKPQMKTDGKMRTKDIRISYDTNWQKNHLRSITSAYNSSPFLEYYIDDILPLYDKRWDFLLDFNHAALTAALDMLDISKEISFTKEYIKNYGDDVEDLRETIHPKKDYRTYDIRFSPVPYYQLFTEKQSFYPNLSILDLIFNMGPETCIVLENSISREIR